MNKVVILFGAAFLSLGLCGASALDLYVATTGNDGNNGSETKPFRSLERARDEIHKLKTGGALPKSGVSVIVRGGTYCLSNSLVIGPQESGTEAAPLVWAAAPNEAVRLCGGTILAADSFKPISDEKVLARLNADIRDKVLQADMQKLGLPKPGVYPDNFRGAPLTPELFFNDERQKIARWPNEGWATIDKIYTNEPSISPGTFGYSGDRPARWNVDAGVWLLGYWSFDWYEENIKIKSIDASQHHITLVNAGKYGIKQGNPAARRFSAVNLLEELDEPGEYYIDTASAQLYFWPPSDLAKARIVVSSLKAPMVELKDASHVVLRGFTVEAGLGDGIGVTGGISNCVDSCEVRNTREVGVHVAGGTGHRVMNCIIHDTGTGGIVLDGGDRKTLTPAGHEALNNQILRFSQLQLTYAAGILLVGVGNHAAHNEIHDAQQFAIYIKGNDNIIELNFIHDLCTTSDDSGALYKGRNPSCRGNIIRYNYWRDIGNPKGSGTSAIYFDDGDGGDTVFGNVFLHCGYYAKTPFGAIFSNGGFDLVAENNIFIECKRAFGSYPWKEKKWHDDLFGSHSTNWQNRLLKEVDITKPPYTTHYPELVGYLDPQGAPVRISRTKNNVLVRCDQVSSGNWTNVLDKTWTTDQDPGFVDYAKGNLKLRPDSEVFKRLPAFDPIPFDQIGIQKIN